MTKICELTGQKVVKGRNVSHTKGHNTRTSRSFVPNLKNTTFKSDALGVSMTLTVATGTIRTINKYGGFDSFIINYKFAKLSDFAKTLRKKIKNILVDRNEYENIRIVKVRGDGKNTK